ncbi:hypothetical protein AMECASPLE_013678 [Ameca splendens]|uniref:Dirigent protein n=1 Tax=Ameca splendens TaxID=208324 RepID=A0ABV0XQA1_9TELE
MIEVRYGVKLNVMMQCGFNPTPLSICVTSFPCLQNEHTLDTGTGPFTTLWVFTAGINRTAAFGVVFVHQETTQHITTSDQRTLTVRGILRPCLTVFFMTTASRLPSAP